MTLTPQDLALLRRRQASPTRPRHALTPRPRRERDIQRAILDFLRSVPGVVAWKTGGGLLPLADGRRVRMGHKGVSDIVGFRSEYLPIFRPNHPQAPRRPADEKIARFLAIEVKRPGRRATEEQMAFLDAVVRAGGIALIASSVDEVAAALGRTQ